jgi:sortase B
MPWKKKRTVNERLIIITATCLILTLTTLGYYLEQYREADVYNQEIVRIAFDVQNTKAGSIKSGSKINHAALKARNHDYIGWIKVDGTDISHPIVQSKEELFYLRRNFDKQYSIPGTIFMDYHNNKYFTDTNTMIFGHHMNDGSMFAPLKKFLKNDFFDKNKYIEIYTPEGDFRYEIFAVYETSVSNVPYKPGMMTEKDMSDFLAQVKKLALHSRELNISAQDKLLTLSTCGYDLRNARILVHAKLVVG